jgi:hypothetical protein
MGGVSGGYEKCIRCFDGVFAVQRCDKLRHILRERGGVFHVFSRAWVFKAQDPRMQSLTMQLLYQGA